MRVNKILEQDNPYEYHNPSSCIRVWLDVTLACKGGGVWGRYWVKLIRLKILHLHLSRSVYQGFSTFSGPWLHFCFPQFSVFTPIIWKYSSCCECIQINNIAIMTYISNLLKLLLHLCYVIISVLEIPMTPYAYQVTPDRVPTPRLRNSDVYTETYVLPQKHASCFTKLFCQYMQAKPKTLPLAFSHLGHS